MAEILKLDYWSDEKTFTSFNYRSVPSDTQLGGVFQCLLPYCFEQRTMRSMDEENSKLDKR